VKASNGSNVSMFVYETSTNRRSKSWWHFTLQINEGHAPSVPPASYTPSYKPGRGGQRNTRQIERHWLASHVTLQPCELAGHQAGRRRPIKASCISAIHSEQTPLPTATWHSQLHSENKTYRTCSNWTFYSSSQIVEFFEFVYYTYLTNI